LPTSSPDNDLPGTRHAETVAQNLIGIAREVCVVTLPWLGVKEDVFDWIARGGTKEKLEELGWGAPQWTPTVQLPNDHAGQSKPQPPPVTAIFKSARADTFKMKAVTWLWPDRFAIGKLGIIAGLPDEGKGQILCDMAARITRGLLWPCNEGTAPKGSVIHLSAEDDPEDTIVPRLAAAGADLSRIELLTMVQEKGRIACSA
jgi:hypothetical protein